MLLENRTAIVTGATRGIGRAIALTLAREGASLVINAIGGEKLEVLAKETGPSRCVTCAGDISDPSVAERLARTALERFGKIDVLVNNAGINRRSTTLDMSIDDWRRVMDVNLNGTLHACRAVLPHMIGRRYGKIVNVSSSAAKTPHKSAAPSYGASKAGINYLTQHLAFEMAKHGIYVNAVCPGPVETDMSKQWTAEYRERVSSGIPLRKLGEPQNVADAVLFLASGMSDFITGESINVNGGAYMN
jgi:3-oxoacyl-[acyl-carrier protein] reductase